jgi:hypothetical protein
MNNTDSTHESAILRHRMEQLLVELRTVATRRNVSRCNPEDYRYDYREEAIIGSYTDGVHVGLDTAVSLLQMYLLNYDSAAVLRQLRTMHQATVAPVENEPCPVD